jgi:hypothetical protein
MASTQLQGRTVAFLKAQEGVEEIELTEPWKAVQDAGATPQLIAPERSRRSIISTKGRPTRPKADCPRVSWLTDVEWTGALDDGRGGFRTCDLSRVKRALSH